jgi:uncharacterized protein
MNDLSIKLPVDIDDLTKRLKKGGVKHAQVFGSYARGDQTPESDLDLLVEYASNVNVFGMAGLSYELEESYPIKIDLVRKRKDNSKRFIETIADDLVELF